MPTATASRNQANRVSKPALPPRRSARLQGVGRKPTIATSPGKGSAQAVPQCDQDSQKKEQDQVRPGTHLPSPSRTTPPEHALSLTRKRKLSHQDSLDRSAPKVPRIAQRSDEESAPAGHLDPIGAWVDTGYWPKGRAGALVNMTEPLAQAPSKRRSSSVHRSELKRQRAEHGVYMMDSRQISQESKIMCGSFLDEGYEFVSCTLYPESALLDVLERVKGLNEDRIQRDIMPRVVPPAEVLRYYGEPIPASICEDLNALWRYCQPKGGTIPKPDYTAGLSTDAFNGDEVQELQKYSSPARPFMFTPDVCFPFLTCEAKSGDQALSRAQSQNVNNGSVAVGAILELYKAVFGGSEPQRVSDLYGKVLVFSVSHDNAMVNLWGHYVVLDAVDGREKYYYHEIDAFSLTVRDGRDKNKAYNFVRNVYERFAPVHLARIKAAVACLPAAGARTGLSATASDLGLEDRGSRPDEQQASQEGGFRVPDEPASTSKVREEMQRLMEQQRKQMERQVEEHREQTERQMEQMELQWRDTKKMEEQMEQQRRESKEQIDKLLQQIERQRQEQLEQQKKIISLLEQSRT